MLNSRKACGMTGRDEFSFYFYHHPHFQTEVASEFQQSRPRRLLRDTLVTGSEQEGCCLLRVWGVCPWFGDRGSSSSRMVGCDQGFIFLWLLLGLVRFLVLSSEDWDSCKVPLYSQDSKPQPWPWISGLPSHYLHARVVTAVSNCSWP